MIVTCNGCGKSLKVADEHAGRRARCPSCETLVSIPTAEPAMQAAAPIPTPHRPAPLPTSPASPVQANAPNVVSYDDRQQTAMVPSAPPPIPQQQAQPQQTSVIPAPNYNNGYQNSGYQGVQPVVHHHHHNRGGGQDPAIAALLEVLGGMFIQTFGIGHIYAGNIAVGLLFMFGYWAMCVVNFILLFVAIGFITYPLTWVAAMILSPILAANHAKRY